MYDLLILAAAFLFSLQFLVQQSYQRNYGKEWTATLDFTFCSSMVSAAVLFAMEGFAFSFSRFALLVALAYAVCHILFFYTGMKAFLYANLSVFSMFAMLGGMLLPFGYGIFFCGERLTVPKLIGCILIVLALLPALWKAGGSTGGISCYLAIFMLNGLIGVLAKVHQDGAAHADSISFLLMTRLWMAALAIILLLGKRNKRESKSRCLLTAAGTCTGYALCSCVGNLLVLIGLLHLPVSVQYPIITGGTMIFSALLSLLRREKVTKWDLGSTFLAFCAMLVIVLP